MQLKDFQKNTLSNLKEYLEKARLLDDPEQAFVATVQRADGRVPVYHKVEGLEHVPYVCLRLPTGGGKTIVGAYAIRTAAQSFIEKDFPIVLWLVPTNTIRTQTADALKNPAHPYRIALDEAFERRVRVFDISEIENIRPQDLTDSVCIVVGTIQTLRVERTEGRDVYAHKEALEDHFTRLNVNVPGLERIEEGANAGKLKYSFANLMAVHQPMVIVDEAHNVRTGLSFDALRRVSPSCIVELTATPDTTPRTGSNVLHRVSASELKAEEMIKLPIVLTVHEDSWESAIGDALRTRQRLAELASAEPDYVRPILLIQAENKDRPANVEAVKKYLVESENISEDHIAIATGEQRELDNVNLFDRACPVEVIITVQALKEGWDCSFAYVFCSVANTGSSKDVEQLLGRVLRMPYVSRRKASELNKAYAHVSSKNFVEAAKQLETSMIAMGFEDTEAQQYIEVVQHSLPDLPLFLQANPLTLTLERPLDTNGLSEREQQSVIVKDTTRGIQVEVHGEITHTLRRHLLESVPDSCKDAIAKQIDGHIASQQRWVSPSQRGEKFIVPRLCVHYQGELELFEKELLLDAAGWNLLDYAPELDDFRFNDASKTFEFDVDGSHVVYEYKGEQQLDLNVLPSRWSPDDLIRWLDKQLRQQDVRQEILLAWLQKAVDQLLSRQHFDLPTLVRAKFILARKLEDRLNQCRMTAYNKGYQELLFGPSAAVETSYSYAFAYDPNVYPANWFYSGRHRFPKHFYPVPGELRSDGEEFDCAVALDAQPSVKHWVRNLSQQPTASVWLQTSTDRFYPDFMAELTDGRLLMVEYKGNLTAQTDDTDEKRRLGKLWAEKSHGKALFVLAERRDQHGRSVFDQIKAATEVVPAGASARA